MNREVKTGEWVELDEAYPLQRIESGTFEIYVVYAPASGRTRRKYLCEEGPGGYLYFFPDEGGDTLRLLAIATSPAVLRPMNREDIVTADIRQQVLCLESLLKILSCRPERHLLPRTSKSLDAGTRETLPAGTRLVAPPGLPLAWLELPREAVGPDDTDRFFGESELLYLPAGDSVAMTADAEVAAWDTETVISRYGKNFVIEASYSEAVQFGRAYRSYFEAEDRTDAGRLGEFARMKELLLSNSFSELMRNLIPDLPFVSRMEDRNQPPVIHALQEIGEWFGIARDRFRLPDGAEQFTEVRDILRILGNRDLHGREVSLEPGWEKTDIGPLLAFRDGTPLAVLPVTPEHYEYVDLEAGKRVPVTAEIAAGFDTRAYCFCQGLPEDIDSLWKWFRWAARLCWERDYWLLLFCCLIAGFIPVITPLVTQTIFNDIIPSYDKNALLLVVQVMFVTSVSGALISLVRGITVLRLKNHVRVSAESALWIKLLSLPAAFFRRYQVGDLALRMQGVSALSHQLSSTVANGIFNGIFCFWNLLLMFWYSYKMALLAVFVWFVFLVLSLIFSWRKVRFQREKATASGRVSGQLLQLLNGLNKFRLRAAEERAFYLWTKPFGVSGNGTANPAGRTTGWDSSPRPSPSSSIFAYSTSSCHSWTWSVSPAPPS
ncbi:MAG: hypothetical protein IJS96_08445 [Schwartzia sp.]|nr:hypothetical protein [Schwartzia sp. (in: firmicutes)]